MSRSPSPITMVPPISDSSMALRIASTAARSAPIAVAAAHQPRRGDGPGLGGGNGLAGDQLVHLVHRPRAISAGSGAAR